MARRKIANDSLIGVAFLRAIEPLSSNGKKPDLRDVARATKSAADAAQLPVLLAIAHHNGAGNGDRSDGWPSQMEYAAWWKISERTAQRDWARFDQVFGKNTLYDLAKAVYANYTSEIRAQDVSVVYKLPGDLLAA